MIEDKSTRTVVVSLLGCALGLSLLILAGFVAVAVLFAWIVLMMAAG